MDQKRLDSDNTNPNPQQDESPPSNQNLETASAQGPTFEPSATESVIKPSSSQPSTSTPAFSAAPKPFMMDEPTQPSTGDSIPEMASAEPAQPTSPEAPSIPAPQSFSADGNSTKLTPESTSSAPSAPPVSPTTTHEGQPSATVTPSATVGATALANQAPLPVPDVTKPTVDSSAPVAGQTPAGGKKHPKKKLLIIGGVVALTLIAVAGFVFGYYIPNQPDNVYSTGLDRTGEVLQELILEATEEDALEAFSQSEVTMSAVVTAEGNEINGTFTSKLNDVSSDSQLGISVASDTPDQDMDIALSILTDLQADNRFPDVFLRFSGYRGLGLEGFVPGIDAYDGKWIAITADYIEENFGEYIDEEVETDGDITHEDITELATVTTDVTNRYIFTSDPENAVFENREFVGEEQLDDVTAYRYVVGLNIANAKKYCAEISEQVINTQAYKKMLGLSDEDVTDAVAEARESCEEDVEISQDDTTFDMWIDKKYKLIHKVRVYEQETRDNYIEIGQNYTGGNNLSIFALYHNEEDNLDWTFEASTNPETSVTSGSSKLTKNGENPVDMDITFEIKPYSGDINVERPTDVLDVQDVLEALGNGSVLGAQSDLDEPPENIEEQPASNPNLLEQLFL
ncbi:hypothetical protein BH23PAT2_BH23PAT2_03540 [soil metagenome]